MAHNTSLVIALLHIFALSFLNILVISNGFESGEISCLRSIKESLEDPYNKFKHSWNFGNTTRGFICNFVGVTCWNPDENRIIGIELGNMRLKGQFPRTKNCWLLTHLNLSGNELTGTIPSEISDWLPFVTVLDLSSNNFSGEIPKRIWNCTYLNVLRLDNNQLTGLIPPELFLLYRIKNFSVANNRLSGPKAMQTIQDFVGAPLDPCMAAPANFHVLFKQGFLVGWVFSTVSVVVVIFLYTPWVPLLNATTKNNKRMKEEINGSQGSATTERSKNVKHAKMMIGSQISQLERMITRMSFTELREATGNFNTHNFIGLGKIGIMYKAVLPNGWPLAVKRFYESPSFEKQFVSELFALGRLRHKNLFPLLGYCKERKGKLLVYKYILNGNLCDWLHAMEGNDKILEWHLRIKIAIGIARGLAWLHHKCNFRVVHLSLSSTSILLDKNFEPKISNFGGAKISNSEGALFLDSIDIDSSNGSFVDSGVWELGFVKKDVYDFGILLLELIIGKEPFEINNYSKSSNVSLLDWITHLLTSSSNLYSAIDKSLIG
ncbi:putativeinactive leucine-rich repeat receptor-like protein kinase [Quercus suber]|uniref:Putativeinactive leucine-rich repeat receptor-like protein kinase n=1 Tax=Quercus suber TaxID=58331 RepID=A0AAW0KTA1_QUESU